jgi:hypothetical protein
MLCYEDSHITHENTNFKISFLCLLPFHHVIWIFFWGGGEIQWTAKNILHLKENHQNNGRY